MSPKSETQFSHVTPLLKAYPDMTKIIFDKKVSILADDKLPFSCDDKKILIDYVL